LLALQVAKAFAHVGEAWRMARAMTAKQKGAGLESRGAC
jgi:hypothetical protein